MEKPNGKDKYAHPHIFDHSTENIERLAEIATDLSHDNAMFFDELQDIANLLRDWAAVRNGWTLMLLDGTKVDIMTPDSEREVL